ncbi:MAG: DUF655 domain-containing protein [Nitrososphaerales archaeon]
MEGAATSSAQQPRKYEEYAYVLDVSSRSRSVTVRGREGTIIQVVGEERLTLLELLGMPNMAFDTGERLYIGREGRTKVLSVLGRLDYESLSPASKDELPEVIEQIVKTNEKRFVDYINSAQPINPRIHSLELIPGIGKTYMKVILDERDKKPFENFDDLQERVGLREPLKLIARRILDEVSGSVRMNIFVRK